MFETISIFGWYAVGFIFGLKIILFGLLIIGALCYAAFDFIREWFASRAISKKE